MNIENNNSFFIENKLNFGYCTNILFALFYLETDIRRLLNKDLSNFKVIYFIEYMKINFIDLLNQKKSIVENDLVRLKEIISILGWCDKINSNMNLEYFFIFLMKALDNLDNNFCNHQNIIKINLENDGEYKLNKKLIEWINKNLEILNLKNIPDMIPIFINHNNINSKLDIQKKIIPFKNKNSYHHEWIIHSIICYDNVHYYTIFSKNPNIKKWYIFNENKIPCIESINLNDKTIVENIKKDCRLIIYRLLI